MKHENTMPVRLYGNSPAIEASMELDPHTCRKLTAIIIYCGNIEYHLERAIWKLAAIDPKGIRPKTDSKPITKLIEMFEALTPEMEKEYPPHWMRTWCKATRSGFTIRNNIAHGVTSKLGDPISFMRNPRYEGELRNREHGSFWCNPSTLDFTALRRY